MFPATQASLEKSIIEKEYHLVKIMLDVKGVHKANSGIKEKKTIHLYSLISSQGSMNSQFHTSLHFLVG
jgi:hypothetical protein